MTNLAGVVSLVAGRAEKQTWCVEQFADGENDHQSGNECQMNQKDRIGGHRLPVKAHQAEHENLHGHDVGVCDETHRHAG